MKPQPPSARRPTKPGISSKPLALSSKPPAPPSSASPSKPPSEQLGNGTDINAAYLASLRILNQEIQGKDTPKELEIPFGAHLVRMNRLQTATKERNAELSSKVKQLNQMRMMDGGMGGGIGPFTPLNPAEADYYMAQAELWVAEIKAGSTAPTGLQAALKALDSAVFKTESIDPFGRRSSTPARASSPKPAEPELAQGFAPAAAAPEDPFAEAAPAPYQPAAAAAVLHRYQPGSPSQSHPRSLRPSPNPPTTLAPRPSSTPSTSPSTSPSSPRPPSKMSSSTSEPPPKATSSPTASPSSSTPPATSRSRPLQRANRPPAGENEGGGLDSGPPNISEALRTLQTEPILIDLKGVPLKTSLRLILKQAGLGYVVKDGIILIGVLNTNSFQQELFNGTIVPKYGEAGTTQIMGGMGGGFR